LAIPKNLRQYLLRPKYTEDSQVQHRNNVVSHSEDRRSVGYYTKNTQVQDRNSAVCHAEDIDSQDEERKLPKDA
jgi:hypothetical protein